MLTYHDTIKYLSRTKSTKLFKNKGSENARLVLAEIFLTAKEEILLFAGNIKGDVSDSEIYQNAVNSFLINTTGTIKVFLENDLNEDNNHKVYQILRDFKLNNPSRVNIKTYTDQFIAKVKDFFKEEELYHFIVADRRIFRVEIDPKTYKAIASFNSPDFAKRLSNLFLDSFDLKE